MADGDIEAIRAFWEAFNRGDRDTALAVLAPDAVLHPPPERMTGGADAYEGEAGWNEYADILEEMLADLRYEPVEFFPMGEGVLLVHVTITGTGRGSGVPFHQQVGHVYEMADGRVRRLRVFVDRARARAVAEAAAG